ncbi:hypothetical protein [Chromobacterium alticapitis]|nr:hypothetical protein [Chromobacterium alticapitis]
MKRNTPIAAWPCNNPDELYKAISFGDADALAKELAVSTAQVTAWRTGQDPVPKAVFLWLTLRNSKKLGPQFGPFRGFELCDRGDALVCPDTGIRMNHAEVYRLPDYRRAQRLVEQQAELIERLMKERNFYRKNCHQQARFGMLLNQVFQPDID